jgi:hypothetical protein
MEVVRLAEPWKYDSTCLRVPWVKGPQQDAGRPLKLGFALQSMMVVIPLARQWREQWRKAWPDLLRLV